MKPYMRRRAGMGASQVWLCALVDERGYSIPPLAYGYTQEEAYAEWVHLMRLGGYL